MLLIKAAEINNIHKNVLLNKDASSFDIARQRWRVGSNYGRVNQWVGGWEELEKHMRLIRKGRDKVKLKELNSRGSKIKFIVKSKVLNYFWVDGCVPFKNDRYKSLS